GVEDQDLVLVGGKRGQTVSNRGKPQSVFRARAGILRQEISSLVVHGAVAGEIDDEGLFGKIGPTRVPIITDVQLAGLVLEPELARSPEERRVRTGANFQQVIETSPAVGVVRNGQVVFVACSEKADAGAGRRPEPTARPAEQSQAAPK